MRFGPAQYPKPSDLSDLSDLSDDHASESVSINPRFLCAFSATFESRGRYFCRICLTLEIVGPVMLAISGTVQLARACWTTQLCRSHLRFRSRARWRLPSRAHWRTPWCRRCRPPRCAYRHSASMAAERPQTGASSPRARSAPAWSASACSLGKLRRCRAWAARTRTRRSGKHIPSRSGTGSSQSDAARSPIEVKSAPPCRGVQRRARPCTGVDLILLPDRHEGTSSRAPTWTFSTVRPRT